MEKDQTYNALITALTNLSHDSKIYLQSHWQAIILKYIIDGRDEMDIEYSFPETCSETSSINDMPVHDK
jgi:hypothetical protein